MDRRAMPFGPMQGRARTGYSAYREPGRHGTFLEMGMTEMETNTTLTERLYALLAYTSAVTIFALGGYLISLAMEDAIMSAPWKIVLATMAVPLLAAAVAPCGNHREKPQVRAVTWGIVVPLGIVNPIAWLGVLVIIARSHAQTVRQPA